jgi:hypothetical protein
MMMMVGAPMKQFSTTRVRNSILLFDARLQVSWMMIQRHHTVQYGREPSSNERKGVSTHLVMMEDTFDDALLVAVGTNFFIKGIVESTAIQ